MNSFSFSIALFLTALVITGCSIGSHDLTPTPVPPAKTGSLQGIVYFDQLNLNPSVAQVLRSGERPIAGAQISVRGYPGVTATSDANGAFTLLAVPCGVQTFYVATAGYTRTTFIQTIQEGTNSVQSSIYTGQVSRGKWTVLVYMCADNNLEGAAIDDVNEMEAAVPAAGDVNPPVTVLAQLDRSPGYDTSNGDWYGARRLRIVHDANMRTMVSPCLDETPLGVINMGNRDTLRNFIRWGMQTAPAERYIVILWNHGSGWDPVNDRSAFSINRAVCIDASSNSAAIRDADLSYALTGTDPIDIVAMDVCYMAMFEVAYQIRCNADYLVAAEVATPWEGFNYSHFVSKLATEQGMTSPAELAAYMAQDNYATWRGLHYTYMTASAVDLSRMDSVAKSLDTLARQLLKAKDINGKALRRARAESTPIGTAGSETQFYDLCDYAGHLGEHVWNRPVRQSAIDLVRDVKSAVLVSAGDIPYASGLSIYFPPAQEFTTLRYDRSYANMALAQDTAWDEWLAVHP